MDLRYQHAVVAGAGDGLGREIAVALARLGVAVLAVDGDGAAAEETAALCRRSRVAAWAMSADVTDPVDARLVAGRAHDLGGADLVVNPVGGHALLTDLIGAATEERRGRRTPAGVVNLAADRSCVVSADADLPIRVMAVVAPPTVPAADVVRAVIALLTRGETGRVVELAAP